MPKETLLQQSTSENLLTISGVTYFKLAPGFTGDVTKNCGLTGDEVDKNFYFLRGYDIDTIKLDEQKNLVITRVDKNYSPLVVELGGEEGNPTFELNRETGTLIVTYPNGSATTVEGFLTDIANVNVFTDETLRGNGKQSNKLGLSPIEKTGTYSPVEILVNTVSGDTMPDDSTCGVGYRVVTCESVDVYGYLYSHSDVEKIMSALTASNSDWEIPSKDDWDAMLNAFECADNRNHSGKTADYYGYAAGSALKSPGTLDDNGLWLATSAPDAFGNNTSDLSVYPVGMGRINYDGLCDIIGINEEACYWTSTDEGNDEIYTKIFSYRTGGVKQALVSKRDTCAAIRLVNKNVNQPLTNFATILGINYPIKLVNSIYDDYQYSALWTKINLFNPLPEISNNNRLSGSTPNMFCVCEWDGHVWVKKAMNEGDTVVIKGDDYTEYILKNGELLPLTNSIGNKINELQSAITITNETINEFSGSVSTSIDNLNGEDVSGDTYTLNSSSEMVLRRKNNNNDIKLKISDDFFDFGVITH